MDKSDEKKSKEKATLSPTKSTQEVRQIKTSPINTSSSPIARKSSYQHPANRKRKIFVVGDSHLERLNKFLTTP